MKPFSVLFCLGVCVLLLTLVMKAGEIPPAETAPGFPPDSVSMTDSVSRVDEWLEQTWADRGIRPAAEADDMTVYRRLSLALHGTIPSLEEIAVFRKDDRVNRLERWLEKLLQDDRFADYFADRLERVLTGVDEGQFIVFRRDRLRHWLGEQLRADRPWQEVVMELIAAEGLWTSQPASNFITAASIPEEGIDVNELAGRTVRAFLGQRIDCAQCHNHPFDIWKQTDFEGLAAFYGQARVKVGGVIDCEVEEGKPVEYRIIDPGSDTGRVIDPVVPFHAEWLGQDGSRRQRLAEWVTHPGNRRFERAIANRIWGLMFGRAWYDPVDDLPHPDSAEAQKVSLLDVLGAEFRRSGGSLKSLIRTIALSKAFRLRSDAPEAAEDEYAQMKSEWAVFPLSRLRPEQMIGSIFQAGHIRTIDQQSNMFVRFARFFNENDFLKEYGDATDDELLQQSGTIPQALLRMNGKFTREQSETGPFSAAGQILRFSGDNESVVNNCFLACLTRQPTTEERTYFSAELGKYRVVGDSRSADSETLQTETDQQEDDRARGDRSNAGLANQVVEDLYWVLFNSPEFSWNR
ncbi:MAG: DUF1549 domain-containing protein [Planctomycetaceae bacterium]